MFIQTEKMTPWYWGERGGWGSWYTWRSFWTR